MNRQPHRIQETQQWLALDKPAGLVIHPPSSRATQGHSAIPGEKHAGSTLVDWLRSNVAEIEANFPADETRPGIVHRLDADTSGVILVAKDPETLRKLQDQFRARTVQKTYQALVLGDPGPRGTLTGVIGRAGEDTRQAVKRLSFSWEKGRVKPAETAFETLEQYSGSFTSQESVVDTPNTSEVFPPLTLLELRPKTGRTHQLRVQLLDHGTPIIGDQTYNSKESRAVSEQLGLHRQFLHAVRIQFTDPTTKLQVVVESLLASDLQQVLDQLGYSQ